jgi:calcineurin-like phosphoesterase family protein
MDNPLYLPLLARLNGRLVFVGGNNDTRRICKLLEQYAEAVVGALEYKGFIVTHIPVHTQEVSRFKGNIHGHTHDRYVRKLTYEPLSVKVKDEPDNRYLNVSWDVLDGYPMSIEKVIEYFNDRKTEFESVKSIKR